MYKRCVTEMKIYKDRPGDKKSDGCYDGRWFVAGVTQLTILDLCGLLVCYLRLTSVELRLEQENGFFFAALMH